MSATLTQPSEALLSQLNLFKTSCIVVDDREDDLLAILWGLQTAGMSCVPLRYDAITGLQNANMEELSSARLVFLDLNLERTLDRGASDQAKNIIEVLETLKLRGPYILIVWSDFRAKVDEVLGTAFQRASNVIFPVGIAVLNKEKFLIPGNDDTEDASYDFHELGQHISKIISEYPQVFSMMAWENRAMVASSTVTKNLFRLRATVTLDELSASLRNVRSAVDATPEGASTPVISEALYSKKDISKIFYKIGYAASGKYADEDPASAVESGLLPLLEDQFLSIPAIDACIDTWKKVFQESQQEKLTPDVICKLNSCLLIDVSQSDSPRGLFLELLDSSTDTFQASHLETDKTTLQEHFFNEEKLAAIVKKDGEEKKNVIVKSCIVGILECSAACDHAQNKIGVRLGLLAAIIPVEHEKCINKDQNIYHDGIKIHFNGKDYLFLISFKYPFGITQAIIADPTIAKPLFRVREQLLSAIAARFASHASRPGFISVH